MFNGNLSNQIIPKSEHLVASKDFYLLKIYCGRSNFSKQLITDERGGPSQQIGEKIEEYNWVGSFSQSLKKPIGKFLNSFDFLTKYLNIKNYGKIRTNIQDQAKSKAKHGTPQSHKFFSSDKKWWKDLYRESQIAPIKNWRNHEHYIIDPILLRQVRIPSKFIKQWRKWIQSQKYKNHGSGLRSSLSFFTLLIWQFSVLFVCNFNGTVWISLLFILFLVSGYEV